MIKAVAINGSPVKQKGSTAMLLTPFIQGIVDNGAEVELFYASDLKVCNQQKQLIKQNGLHQKLKGEFLFGVRLNESSADLC